MEKYGPIVAIGAIAILMILLSSVFPLSPEVQKGFIFVGIALLLFIVSAIAFAIHFIVGIIVGLIGITLFILGVNSFVDSTQSMSTGYLPIVNFLFVV